MKQHIIRVIAPDKAVKRDASSGFEPWNKLSCRRDGKGFFLLLISCGNVHLKVRHKRKVIRGNKSRPTLVDSYSFKNKTLIIIDVVKVYKGQDTRVGSPGPKLSPDIFTGKMG